MNAPGFWDDQAQAARLGAEHARVSRRLEGYRRLRREYDDTRELFELDGGEMEGELSAALAPLHSEIAELQESALFDGEYDAGDAVVTLQSGTGGTDAQDWAEIMLRMYERWAQNRKFKVELLEASPGEEAGLKSATFTVVGENAYGILKAERGKHRLVRLSPFDQAHRRHTSFASLDVIPLLPETEEEDLDIDPKDLRIDVYRSSSAGGQSVNTTDSAVRITHKPSGIVVAMQDEKSQLQNREKAMRVLRARLYEQKVAEQQAAEAADRRAQVGTGERAEKIRTYNFPQGRVTDHRVKHTAHNLDAVLAGELDEFTDALWDAERRERLTSAAA